VVTADQMAEKAIDLFEKSDVAILAAAVADYTPVQVAAQKMKKSDNDMNIALKLTTDIAGTLGRVKQGHQRIVGFALETENLAENALKKMQNKNMDMIVGNDATAVDSGFGGDNNTVTMFLNENRSIALQAMHKSKVAQTILDTLCENFL
jgi:phosphopantothenoylcysteine decarboxylase/phosphopantothenate--cysteine ligase